MDASVYAAERNRRPRRVRGTQMIWSEGEFRHREVWWRRKNYGEHTIARPPESRRTKRRIRVSEEGRAGRFAEIFARGSRRAELSGVDTVALHLDVQGLVVDPEESRRLTFVAQCGLKGQSDRLPLRLGDGAIGDLPQ